MTMRVSRVSSYGIAAAVLLLSVAVYWNSLGNEFVNWDDDYMIVNNVYIRSLDLHNLLTVFTPPGVVSDYRPVRTFSYAIDYHFWQLNPLGYHITNLFWNSVSVLFVYLIGVSLSGNILFSLLAASIFAVHPVHVEAVAWLSGRREVLSTALALAAFYAFLRIAPSPAKRRRFTNSALYIVSLAAFVPAIFTKQSVIVLPLLLVLSDLCFLPSRVRSRDGLRIYLPFFLSAAGFVLLYFWFIPPESPMKTDFHGGGAYSTFLTMMRTFAEYVYTFVVPQHLSTSYGIQSAQSFCEPPVLFAALLLAGLTLGLFWAWKREKLVFFGLAWFFIGLLPVSNIIPISTIKADRHVYFPSFGLCLAAAWLTLAALNRLKRLTLPARSKTLLIRGCWAAVLLVLASYAVQTVDRNRDWKNSEALWTATLEANPENPIALNNLGIIYAERGWNEQALALFKKLLDSGVRYERLDGVLLNVGHVYAALQDFESALDYYRQALLKNPELEDAYTGMGRVYMQTGNDEQAIENFRQALHRNPKSLKAHILLGDACFQVRRFPCAIEAYTAAINLAGENQELLQKLERAQNAVE